MSPENTDPCKLNRMFAFMALKANREDSRVTSKHREAYESRSNRMPCVCNYIWNKHGFIKNMYFMGRSVMESRRALTFMHYFGYISVSSLYRFMYIYKITYK